MIKRTFTDSAPPAPESGENPSSETQPQKSQEVKQEKGRKLNIAGKKEASMTNPQKDSHLDSLLGEFGLPVEVQPTGANDEPAEPEVAETCQEVVAGSVTAVSVGTDVAGPESGLEAREDKTGEGDEDGDRRRRRRRRRRPDEENGENRDPRELRGRRGRRRRDDDEDRDGPREMEEDREEEAPEEPFVLEDLSNLQFPMWEELIGSLYRPQDHR